MTEPAASIDYVVVRSPRRRRTISILIKPEMGVVVRAPKSAPAERIHAVVAAKASWITKKLAETRNQSARAARAYVDGETFKFLGRGYPLVIKTAPIKRVAAARFAGGCLVVKTPPGLDDDARRRWVREALRRWYRPRAKSYIAGTVARFSQATGLSPKAVRIKELKRSWAVCTGDNISFNWHLIMAPEPIIEYVVVHELCHLRHKNHAKGFYACLARILPDFKDRRAQLGDISPTLGLP